MKRLRKHYNGKNYTLFKIANFNDDNGQIDQEHQTIGNGIEYKNLEQEPYDEPQT